MVMTAPSLEVAYRTAFEDFSRQARRVQSLAERRAQRQDDRKTFETALVEMEKAHMAYKEARDAFVRWLLPASVQAPSEASPEALRNHSEDIAAIAELLWEGAGRPSGTAEEDWHRAEAIVQRAVASSACGA